MAGKHKRYGFTLAELVVVVLIMGIMAAAAAPKFATSVSFYRAESAAQRVVADLTLARKYAMSTSTTQTVTFALPTDVYTLDGVPDLNHAAQAYTVDLSGAPYQSIVVSAAFVDGNDADVEFNGYGLPDSGGTIQVASGTF